MQARSSPGIHETSVPEILANIRGILAPSRREEADRLGARFAAQRFRLAILGEFKRGKSSVANALIGTPVLPVGVIPTTAVPILVRYGEFPAASTRLRSGESHPISLAELADVSTEKGNPENVRDVALVEVSLPVPLLRSVDLLDSPGTGSAHRHNTEAALAALGEIDAAVVVLAADQPIGQAEIDFLERLRRHVARFFFVVNRVDLISDEARRESVEFVEKVLDHHGFGDCGVYPFSALAATENPQAAVDFGRFRSDLEKFLFDEREQARSAAWRLAAVRLASEELFELRIAEEASRLGQKERELAVALLRESAERLRARRSDREAVWKDRLQRLLSSYDDEFGAFKKGSRREVPREVTTAGARLHRLDNEGYDRELRRIVESGFEARFRNFLDPRVADFSDGILKIAEVIREESDELTQRLYGVLGDAFDLAEPVRAARPDFTGETFDFGKLDVRCQLEATVDFLVLHAPRRLARRFLHRRAERNAEEFCERYGGRLRFELLTKGESFLRRAFAGAIDCEDEIARRLEDAMRDRRASDDWGRTSRIRALSAALEILDAR